MDTKYKNAVPGFNEEGPKSSGFVLDRSTSVSLALVIALVGGAYKYGFGEGAGETGRQQFEARLDAFERKLDRIHDAHEKSVQGYIKVQKDIERMERDIRRLKRQKQPVWDEE